MKPRRAWRGALVSVATVGALGAMAGAFAGCGGDQQAAPTRTAGTAVSGGTRTTPIAETLEPGAARARVSVGDDCLDVFVADTATERGRGLSGRDELGDADGMLFVWDTDSESAFYMFDTRIALSIGWYAADGTPRGRAEMEPCPDPRPEDCPRYRAEGRYRYALEVGGGSLASGPLTAC